MARHLAIPQFLTLLESLFGGVGSSSKVAVKEMTLVLVSLTMVHLEMTLRALLWCLIYKSNETVDILRMLELLQGGGN